MVFPGFCCGENPVCRKACDVQYHFNPLFPHKNIMLAFLGEKTCSLHHYLTTPAWHLRSYSNQAHSLSEQEWYFKRRVMVGCLMACQGSIGMALAIWILSFYQEKKKSNQKSFCASKREVELHKSLSSVLTAEAGQLQPVSPSRSAQLTSHAWNLMHQGSYWSSLSAGLISHLQCNSAPATSRQGYCCMVGTSAPQ